MEETDFMLTLFEKKINKRGHTKYKVRDIYLWDEYEFGMKLFYLSNREDLILVVSPINGVGFVDYKFLTTPFRSRFCQ